MSHWSTVVPLPPYLREKEKKAENFPREEHANKVFLQAVKDDLKEAESN